MEAVTLTFTSLKEKLKREPESEAEYDETNDSLTILSNNADFKFEENTAELDWVLNTFWEGPLSFTMEFGLGREVQ